MSNPRIRVVNEQGQIVLKSLQELADAIANQQFFSDGADYLQIGGQVIVLPSSTADAIDNNPQVLSGGSVTFTPGSTLDLASGSTLILESGAAVTVGTPAAGGGTGAGVQVSQGAPTVIDLGQYPLTVEATAVGAIAAGMAGMGMMGAIQGALVVNAPLEICGVQFWCCCTVGEWDANSALTDWYVDGVGTQATVYRVSSSIPVTLESIAPFTINGVRQPQLIALVNVGTQSITLSHFGAGKPEHQMAMPGEADLILESFDSAILWYDYCLDQIGGAGIWRVLATTACHCTSTSSSLGILGSASSYTGAVKLRAGANITLVDVPGDNAIEIVAAAGGGSGAGYNPYTFGPNAATTGAYVTVFTKTLAGNLHGSWSLKNTGAAGTFVNVRMTATDAWGNTAVQTLLNIASGSIVSGNLESSLSGTGTAYPPYTSLQMEIEDTGARTTYTAYLSVNA